MKTYIMLGILLLITSGAASAQCPGVSKSHVRLQWSESAKAVAPNHLWVAESHPILDADENRTPVTLQKCGGTESWPLFTLQRSADLHWGADSKHVLIINEPLSGTNKLLFFSVLSLIRGAQEAPADALDRTVNETLMERLGKERRIQFYLPRFVSWTGDDLLLAVGGESYAESTSQLSTYCYGLLINSSTLHIEDVLSEKELKAKTGHACQVSP